MSNVDYECLVQQWLEVVVDDEEKQTHIEQIIAEQYDEIKADYDKEFEI